MAEHERHHKEPGSKKGKKNGNSKSFDGEHKEPPKVESQQHVDAKDDTTGRMSFYIDFWLAEGELQGQIIHRPSGKPMKLSARDWTTKITEFLNKYLSSLEKSIATRPVEEPPQETPELAEAHEKEVKETPSRKMQTRSFGVFIKGTDHPIKILQKEQLFAYKWSFEPPASFGIEGEDLDYKVIICRKDLAGGKREIVVDEKGEIKKETDFRDPLIVIPSKPLSAGTYRLEGEANFISSKSKMPESSIRCKESCLILVT
jgi:hypothetical protein